MKATLYSIRFRLLLILIFTQFVIPFEGKTQSATQTTILVELPEQYRNKDIVEIITADLNVRNRYLTNNGFKVSADNPEMMNQLQERLLEANIPYISIHQFKEPVFPVSNDKAGGNNCEIAQLLCSNTSQSANSTGAGTQELTLTNRGCLGVEHQSSWYYLNIETGGSLTFVIDPTNNSDDYDFAVWGPYTSATANANCPPIAAPTRCSYSDDLDQTGLRTTNVAPCDLGLIDCDPFSETTSGNSWCQSLTVTATQIYILLIDNFSNSGNPYNLSFGGTAILGCTPVELPVELSAFGGERSKGGNLLKWITQSEHNSSHFIIEWTTDPLSADWKRITEVQAAGDSEGPIEYGWLHKDPQLRTVNYYRLVQIDTDGTPQVFSDRIVAIDNSMVDQRPVKIINLLGQEVTSDTPGMVIYIFEDGTSRKVVQ